MRNVRGDSRVSLAACFVPEQILRQGWDRLVPVLHAGLRQGNAESKTEKMPSNGFCDKLETLNLGSTHRIVVGVDYGTTFTGDRLLPLRRSFHQENQLIVKFKGACYADTQEKDRDNITLINTWPGPTRDATSALKTPPGSHTVQTTHALKAEDGDTRSSPG